VETLETNQDELILEIKQVKWGVGVMIILMGADSWGIDVVKSLLLGLGL
jgi:hypothetical protein